MNQSELNSPLRFKIVSRADLPIRMTGIFPYAEAYQLCCEWNRLHVPEDLATPELVNPKDLP